MSEIIVCRPGVGESLGRSRLLSAHDELTVLEYTLDAGGEAGDPHFHKGHVDAFFVLDGELEFAVGSDRSVRAPAGSLIVAPQRVVHAFPRAATPRARFLNLHAPGGFDRYMRELVKIRAAGQTPSDDFLASHDIFSCAWPDQPKVRTDG